MSQRRPLTLVGGDVQELPLGDVLDPAGLPGGVLLYQATADMTSGSLSGATSMLSPTGVGSLVLPAGYLTSGRTLRLSGYGLCTTLATAGSSSLQLKAGATILCASAALPLVALQVNVGVSWSITLTCRTAGTSGNVQAMGVFTLGTTSIFLVPSTTALNTTITQSLDLTQSNTIALGGVIVSKLALLESLN